MTLWSDIKKYRGPLFLVGLALGILWLAFLPLTIFFSLMKGE